MRPLPGHQAGVAILSIELETDDRERVLIRVKTVDDAHGDEPPVDRPFADRQAALEYLAGWVDGWVAAAREGGGV